MELFQHQKEGIYFLKEKKKAILADQQGIGKTRQAIIAARESGSKGVLVICPASIKINWQREIAMVYPDEFVQVIKSGQEPTLIVAHWYVINYDLLGKYSQAIEDKMYSWIETVIVDECQMVKGKKTIRSEATIKIAQRASKVYCLTGTPVMNRPIEIFNILRCIDHPLTNERGWLGIKKPTPSKIRSEFGRRYCNAFLQTIPTKRGLIRVWNEQGASRLPELKEKIADRFLRRTKNEVLDLPEKIITTEKVTITPEYKKEYDSAWDDYLEWVSNNPEGKDVEGILTAKQLVELIKLRQICSRAKVDRIVDDVRNMIDAEEKVIIFSNFVETINALKMELPESVSLTGGDTTDARQESVDRFQNDPSVKVFIANIKAGGVGINLTAASIVIFADMDWSPAINEQCEDRAHRIGQNGTLSVYYYVIEDSIEEDIMDVLRGKKEVIEGVVGGDGAVLSRIGLRVTNKL
jgi:SWI/SNF-related matrix-associated actin-dependent regulator 1 of chromatin subfamily A